MLHASGERPLYKIADGAVLKALLITLFEFIE